MYLPVYISPTRLRGFGNIAYDGVRTEAQALSSQITDLNQSTQLVATRFGVDSAVAQGLLERIEALGTAVDDFEMRDSFTSSELRAAQASFDLLVAEYEALEKVSLRNTALLSVGAVGIIAAGAWFIWKKS
jgi:hypothetical protein